MKGTPPHEAEMERAARPPASASGCDIYGCETVKP
jgi:hypothetical protein